MPLPLGSFPFSSLSSIISQVNVVFCLIYLLSVRKHSIFHFFCISFLVLLLFCNLLLFRISQSDSTCYMKSSSITTPHEYFFNNVVYIDHYLILYVCINWNYSYTVPDTQFYSTHIHWAHPMYNSPCHKTFQQNNDRYIWKVYTMKMENT